MNSLDQSSLGDRLPKELEETHLKAVEDVIASQDEEITRIQLEQHKVRHEAHICSSFINIETFRLQMGI
jgi:hypothetical protein